MDRPSQEVYASGIIRDVPNEDVDSITRIGVSGIHHFDEAEAKKSISPKAIAGISKLSIV